MKTLFALALVLTGCAASMVSSPGSSGSRYAPSNESGRPGTIKYLNQGADFVIRDRRESAYKQMYNACDGSYRITSEGPRAEGGVAVPMGSAVNYYSSEYWYITFECE